MRKFGILIPTIAWLIWEIFAVVDGDRWGETWPLTQVLVTYVPDQVLLPGVGILAIWLVAHFVGASAKERRTSRQGLTWLRADAVNRLWRTTLQGIAVTVATAAADAVLQVVQLAVASTAAGNRFDWREVAASAAAAAGTAALVAVASYLHRLKVDPSMVPSAEPPRPPGSTLVEAPATTAPPTAVAIGPGAVGTPTR